MKCVLEWLSRFRWPQADPASAPEHTHVVASWMELVLSFMFYAHGYIPLHRPSEGPNPTFAWARSQSEALAFSYTWNGCATQFATIFGPVVSLCGECVLPEYVHRARICSLYRQGAGTCVFGCRTDRLFHTKTRSLLSSKRNSRSALGLAHTTGGLTSILIRTMLLAGSLGRSL